MIVQAAAGGVGLKSVEYVHWLCARAIGSAGRPHKHVPLRGIGVGALCSSRDGAAFATGVTWLATARRGHGTLNSLSLDFIACSFAALCEGGAHEEIGKRSIWTAERQRAAAPHAAYCAIALDSDMSDDPAWMNGVLRCLASRADGGVVTSLPLQAFDMETQAELAFRTLQVRCPHAPKRPRPMRQHHRCTACAHVFIRFLLHRPGATRARSC
jgi:hypothetical protein